MSRIIITCAFMLLTILSSSSEIKEIERLVEMLEAEQNQPEFVALLEKDSDLNLTADIKLELYDSEFGEQLNIVEKVDGKIVLEHILGEGADQLIFSNSKLVGELSIANIKDRGQGAIQLSFTTKIEKARYRFSIVRIEKFRYKITREKV